MGLQAGRVECACVECGLEHAYGEYPVESLTPVSSMVGVSRMPTGEGGTEVDGFCPEQLATEGQSGFEKACAIHGNGNEQKRKDVMVREGWTQADGTTWVKTVKGAEETVMPPVDGVVRRTTRDASSRVLLEDLWIQSRTPGRLLHRALKKPRDLTVCVELNNLKVVGGGESWEEQPMGPSDATKYRAITARLNFLAFDRADIQFAVKEAARKMAVPVHDDWHLLKRLGRYLLVKPRIAHLYRWRDTPGGFDMYVDSNWTGCPRTRRSTTGACLLHGSHLLRSYSKTQGNVALSSAEAELYAMVSATSEGLGAKAMGMDFGEDMTVLLHVDASAAIGVAQRKGLGRIRHLDTQSLWIQDAVRSRKAELEKVPGSEHPADCMTKHLEAKVLEQMIGKMGLVVLQGRASLAPQLTRDSGLDMPMEDCGLDSLDVHDHAFSSVDFHAGCDVDVFVHGKHDPEHRGLCGCVCVGGGLDSSQGDGSILPRTDLRLEVGGYCSGNSSGGLALGTPSVAVQDGCACSFESFEFEQVRVGSGSLKEHGHLTSWGNRIAGCRDGKIGEAWKGS